jgi:hypothetical protein
MSKLMRKSLINEVEDLMLSLQRIKRELESGKSVDGDVLVVKALRIEKNLLNLDWQESEDEELEREERMHNYSLAEFDHLTDEMTESFDED